MKTDEKDSVNSQKAENQTAKDNEKPLRAIVTITAPDTSGAKEPNTGLRVFEILIDLLKAAAWPLVVLLLFVRFHNSIDLILNQVPDVIAQSTRISVGSLSLEIEKTASQSGSPELAVLLSGTSPGGIEELLVLGKSIHRYIGDDPTFGRYFLPPDAENKAILELEGKGLLKFAVPRSQFDALMANLPLVPDGPSGAFKPTRPLTDDEKKALFQQEISLTPLGLRAFDLVVSVVVKQIRPATLQITATPGN